MREAGEALLRLSADPDAPHGAGLAALSEDEWHHLLARAGEARLVPILARAIERAEPAVEVPGAVSHALAEQKRWLALNALRQDAALVRLSAMLERLGHDPIFLKGVALAHGRYPEPVLRPMRDLDVLLPPAAAQDAQAALLATGDYTVHPDLRGVRRSSPEHFPPLQDSARSTTIEVHHRIGTWPGAAALLDALERDCESLEIGGLAVRVPSSEVNLLHLVAGAAIKDRLAVSALVLTDLHYLSRGPLDWDLAWDIAGRAGLRNALALIAGVAGRFGARWVPPLLSASAERAQVHVDTAVAMLLQPASQAYRQRIVGRVERAGGRRGMGRGAVALALSPDPLQLATIVGVAPSNAWRWAGYPLWFARRAIAYARASADARATGDAKLRMRAWVEMR